MEQRIVSQENDRFIYFIKENQVGFYLIIPRALDVSLVLNVIDHVSDEVIKQLRCPQGQVYVCPVVGEGVLAGLLQNQMESYQMTDDIFSTSLNLAHQILTYNHLNVNHAVYLKNHPTYALFCSWFSKKYNGRVLLLEEEKKEMTTNVQKSSSVTSNEVIQPVSETLNDRNSISNVDTASDMEKNDGASHGNSMGFVSYVLLGVVVAVLSLVFLYFML